VTVLAAALLWWHERELGEDFTNARLHARRDALPIAETTHEGFHAGFLATSLLFNTGSAATPITIGGKLTVLGFAFFVTICVASYTANLANILVERSYHQRTLSVGSIIKSGGRICVQSAVASSFAESRSDLTSADDPALFKKVSRMDIVNALVAGTCQAAVIAEQDIEALQTDEKYCGIRRIQGQPAAITMNLGFPVRESLARSLDYWITVNKMQGLWAERLKAYKPNSQCKEASPEHELGLGELLGPLIFTLGLFLLAVLIHCVRVTRGNHGNHISKEQVSDSSSE